MIFGYDFVVLSGLFAGNFAMLCNVMITLVVKNLGMQIFLFKALFTRDILTHNIAIKRYF